MSLHQDFLAKKALEIDITPYFGPKNENQQKWSLNLSTVNYFSFYGEKFVNILVMWSHERPRDHIFKSIFVKPTFLLTMILTDFHEKTKMIYSGRTHGQFLLIFINRDQSEELCQFQRPIWLKKTEILLL